VVLSYLFLTLSCAQPVPLAVSQLTSDYGTRIWIDGARQFHDGIDLQAPKGTPIKAIIAGEVIFSGVGPEGGNTVVIRELTSRINKITVLYGHLHTISVKKGQNVSLNDIIATVGSTGNATAPHLHLSVWVDNLAKKKFKNVEPNKHFKFCKYKIRKNRHF